MQNCITQVLWLDRDAAGEDMSGAGYEGYGVRACRWVEEYFHPAWVEYKYIGGVCLGMIVRNLYEFQTKRRINFIVLDLEEICITSS